MKYIYMYPYKITIFETISNIWSISTSIATRNSFHIFSYIVEVIKKENVYVKIFDILVCKSTYTIVLNKFVRQNNIFTRILFKWSLASIPAW